MKSGWVRIKARDIPTLLVQYGKTASSSPTMVSVLIQLTLILYMAGPKIYHKPQLLGDN